MRAKIGMSIILVFFLALFSSLGFTEEPEEIWKKLSQLSGRERQNLLLSNARAEGEVVWYTTKPFLFAFALRSEFLKRFPGVELEIWRASGERVINRIMAESRAGKLGADIINVSNEFVPAVRNADLVGRYRSPERKFYPDLFKDREGYWTSEAYIVAVMAYNTNLVSQSEAPRKYEDFLDRKWKGSFAIDTDPDRALMGWLKTWGNERTEKFLEGIIKNDVAIRRGHTLMAQLLCAGEFKAAIELYAFRVAELKEKGCPVKMVFPDPTPGAGSSLIVAKHSRRPYAAALLVDFLLSEGGQRILSDKGQQVARHGIKLKYPEIVVENRGVRLQLLRPEDSEKLGKKYLELRERFLLNRR